MKIILLTFLLITSACYSQTSWFYGPYAPEIISYNTMACPIDNSGVLLRKGEPALATLAPKNEGSSIYYGSWLHFVGISQFGDTLGAAGYGDLYPGPISITNQYLDSHYIQKYHTHIWRVTAGEIANHISEFNINGAVISPSYNISNWPAHGDTTLGVAFNLAPFEDVDNNGIYEPQNGDYPKIKGCESIYVILNDEAYIHQHSDEGKLGIEVHAMVYQYLDGSVLDSTTFADIKVINRSNTNYPEFRCALWNDTDIGCYGDDYFGSDSSLSLGYGYNSTNNDGTCSSWNFTNTPAASGMKFLNTQAHCIMYQPGVHGPVSATTKTAKGNLNYMTGNNFYGTHLSYGGTGFNNLPANTFETNFQFSGNPNLPPSWSMLDSDSSGTPLQSFDTNFSISEPEFTLNSNDEHTLSVAIMYSIAGDAYQGVNTLKNTAQVVQAFYNNGMGECTDPSMGINENDYQSTFELHPNPANDEIILRSQIVEQSNPVLFDGYGVIINPTVRFSEQEMIIDLRELESGVYFISFGGRTKKFVKL